MSIKLLTIALAVSIFLIVIELIREEKLTFKYALGWLIVSICAVVFSVFDQILFDIAGFFGFQLPSNFIFFTLLAIFVFMALLMTLFLCQQNSRNDKTAQRLAILDLELNELKKKFEKRDKNEHG